MQHQRRHSSGLCDRNSALRCIALSVRHRSSGVLVVAVVKVVTIVAAVVVVAVMKVVVVVAVAIGGSIISAADPNSAAEQY